MNGSHVGQVETVVKIWLNVREAAVYLGRSVRAIYNLVHKGGLPSYKFGGRLLFNKDDLDKHIEATRTN